MLPRLNTYDWLLNLFSLTHNFKKALFLIGIKRECKLGAVPYSNEQENNYAQLHLKILFNVVINR